MITKTVFVAIHVTYVNLKSKRAYAESIMTPKNQTK